LEAYAPPDVEASGGTEIVLLVEDESAVRSLTRRILERAGYHVFDANSAQQAEALFAMDVHMFSLLVTDIIMPGSSGPQLFERLVSQRPI
jgi:CheY-like chemotaxis protein